jgi:hypothetical protein
MPLKAAVDLNLKNSLKQNRVWHLNFIRRKPMKGVVFCTMLVFAVLVSALLISTLPKDRMKRSRTHRPATDAPRETRRHMGNSER